MRGYSLRERLLPTSCRLSYQLLQLLLHELCYRWNLRIWILGKLRGEAFIDNLSFLTVEVWNTLYLKNPAPHLLKDPLR